MAIHEELELVSVLDVHDSLVAEYVRGELDWETFDRKYNSFYARDALDGHESDVEGLAVLAKFASRIELHRAVWQQVLTKVSEEYAGAEGFIGSVEVRRRMNELARKHLGVETRHSEGER